MQSQSNESSKSCSSVQSSQLPKYSLLTSLRHECLNNLRFPQSGSNTETKPKTHLLAYMSQFITDEPEMKMEEIDDYFCFERMKKIIEKKKGKGDDVDGSSDCLENQKLIKFIQIQSKMKKLEDNLLKNSSNGKKQGNCSSDKKSKIQKKCQKPHNQQKSITKPIDHIHQSLPSRYSMQKNIKEQGYKQYLQWQKKKITQNENNIREFIETEIAQKVKIMLQERDIKFNELLKEIKILERSIEQKNLEIENMKNKQEVLLKTVRELQNFKDLFSEENKIKLQDRQIMLEKFYHQFQQVFPNYTIKQLHQYVISIRDKCIEKFNDVEYRKTNLWIEEKNGLNEKINKLQSVIHKYQTNQNDLLSNIKQIRSQKNESTMQMDSLLKSKAELQHLQKKILSLYNNWYGELSESEKEVMKSRGYLQTTYEYEQMLEYITVFKSKFSTKEKVNEYLIKLLRGIQRIRKILFPKSVSDPQYKKQIMDPLYILDRLEKYMKNKVYQIQKKNNSMKESRVTQIIEDEFLGGSGDEDASKEKQNDRGNQVMNIRENVKKQNGKKFILNCPTIKKQNK